MAKKVKNSEKNTNARTKKKRNRPEKIMLLLVFLAVLLGVYMFIADKAAEAEDAAAGGEEISMLAVDTADITELSWEYEGENYTLIKAEADDEEGVSEDAGTGEGTAASDDTAESKNGGTATALADTADSSGETASGDGGTWLWKNHEDITLDQSAVESLLTAICTVNATSKIESVTDFAQYGLAEPDSTITFTMKTADDAEGETLKTVSLLTGGYVSVTGEYYAMIAGEDTVYTVDGDYIYDFSIDAAALEYTEDEE